MNKLMFIYKFYTIRGRSSSYNWNLFFPFVGLILGCITVALTLSIMNGMEISIFTKLKNISFSAKLGNMSNSSYMEIEDILIDNKIDYHIGIEDQVLILNKSSFRNVSIHGVEKFNKNYKDIIGKEVKRAHTSLDVPSIYIGEALANKLDISLGDTVNIVSFKQINILSGLPKTIRLVVKAIYKMNILDYESRHIFTDYIFLSNFLPVNKLVYYMNVSPDADFLSFLKFKFPEISYTDWEREHYSFISAIKLEKIAYTVIGFLIIAISSFTLMSMMSLSVMQKISEIGILRTMGARKVDIGLIFLSQALLTWLLGSSVGILISLIIIEFDKYYHIIKILIPGAIFFDFPLILHNIYILLIMIISLIMLLLSSLYPSIKAANLDPVRSIGFNQ